MHTRPSASCARRARRQRTAGGPTPGPTSARAPATSLSTLLQGLSAAAVVLGCGTSSRPGELPPDGPSTARGRARVVTIDGEALVFHDLDTEGVVERHTVLLPSVALGHAWRGPDELVAIDEHGAVSRIVDHQVLPVPEPPRSAWQVPPGFSPSPDIAASPEDYQDLTALAVRGREIWKGRCLEGAWLEGIVCHDWAWLRLDPLDASRTVLDLPGAHPALVGLPAPEGYALERTLAPAASTDGEPRHRLVCRHGATRSTFPDGADDMFARYGTDAIDVDDVVWLGHTPPTYAVRTLVPALETIWSWFVFRACSPDPVVASQVDLVAGPAGWYAYSPHVTGGWVVIHGGREVARLEGHTLSFAPAPR